MSTIAGMEQNSTRDAHLRPSNEGGEGALRPRTGEGVSATLRCLRLLLAIACAMAIQRPARGHGDPTLVTVEEGQLAILAQPATSFLLDEGSGPSASDLSFGVNQPEFGPPPGTDLYLETVGGLYYWNGEQISATPASLMLIPPAADGFGYPVINDLDGYTISAGSTPQTGMLWGTYRGNYYWHADGSVRVPNSSLAAGVYGVPVQLTSPGYEASDPFILTFGWNFGILARQEGALALQSLLALPTAAGDYNHDGVVTSDDYLVWRNSFGSEPLMAGAGADGNADGQIDLADYTIWRNHLGTSASGLAVSAVPEAASIKNLAALLAAALCLASFPPVRRGRPEQSATHLEAR